MSRARDSVQLAFRTAHDLGAAAWFGAALLDVAASRHRRTSPSRRARAADDTRVALLLGAMGTHLSGAVGLLWGNRPRILEQDGAMPAAVAKIVLTGAASAATSAAALRRTPPVVSLPSHGAGSRARSVVRAAADWSVPVSVGAVIALAAYEGQRQAAAGGAARPSGIAHALQPGRARS